jgi:ribosomal protein S18 acetylase RimI-like enzyme
LPAWRAYGHGTALFSGLSEFVEGTLLAAPWLTVWASNTAAVETYKKLGFLVSIQVDNDEQLLVMVRR